MPKKQTDVAVRIMISMPRADQLEDTIHIDPANLIFTVPPKADQVADAARAKVLDDLKIDARAEVTLRLPKGRETIEVKIDDDGTIERVSTAAAVLVGDTLKVRVLNAREALAEIKAFQKTNANHPN